MFRSKVAWAVIGIIVIGGASAAGALLSTAHIGFLAGSTTAQGQATATTTSATQTATAGATASPTSTPPVARSATRTPSGQIIDLHGTIMSIDAGSKQFTLNDTNGATWTIQATNTTTYEGAAQSFDGLRAGLRAEVSGVRKSATTFLAYHVNSDV